MTKDDRLIIENQIDNICNHFEIEKNDIVYKILFNFLETSENYGRYSIHESEIYNLFKFINTHFVKENLKILKDNKILIVDIDNYYTMNFDYLIKDLNLLWNIKT